MVWAVCFAPGAALAAEAVSDAFWLSPRNGEAVVTEPAIESVLRRWVANPEAQIVVRYPGGEEGVLWANDLRDWLVASGVTSSRITLLTGSGSGSVILELE